MKLTPTAHNYINAVKRLSIYRKIKKIDYKYFVNEVCCLLLSGKFICALFSSQ